MSGSWRLVALIAALLGAGCVTQQEFLDSKEATATQTAASRAQFDMSCPKAGSTVLSRDAIQPNYLGRVAGEFLWAEYTVGVEGCGKRHTYFIVCPEGGTGCFAPKPDRLHAQ